VSETVTAPTMSTAKKLNLVSEADYLAGEQVSPVKHEYLGGFVYAMAGARNRHNIIAGNVYVALHNRLRGKPCRPFNSDTKVRVQMPRHVRFYYPDASVVCRQNSLDDSFQSEPVVIVEVLSKKTRRLDEGEKKDAYLSIPSLRAYVLVEQDSARAIVFRRVEADFVPEVYEGLSAVIPLSEIGIDLPLADVYEAIEFSPEADGEDEAGA